MTRRLSLIGDISAAPQCLLGPQATDSTLRLWAVLTASDSLGAWERLARRTVEYLGLREQFGRKLGSFQALKHRLASLHADHYVRGALIRTALGCESAAVQQGVNWALLAKAEVTDAAAHAAAECLQLHGGIGFTREHECHLFLKRVRLNQSLIADNDVLRCDFGRHFVGHVSAAALTGDLHRAVS
jgi:alkylation response protein AidB-like acyl-CoA dehydrogenase